MRIAILGAGAWGTALAGHAASRHQVTLWSRDRAVASEMSTHHRNSRYLPGLELPHSVVATHHLQEATEGADLLVIATSMAGLAPVTEAIAPAGHGAVVWLCKGLAADTGELAHAVVGRIVPGWQAGCLSGPSFAQEVAAGLPVALTAAATDAELALRMVEAFHHGAMRVYRSPDLHGVEIAGALKNVMAVAIGISDGLELGHNARAALMTRGLAEMVRFGIAQGAQAETFLGLAGVGDLVLTCTGDLSRNRTVGLKLAQGMALDAILDQLGHVAEGVACCRAAVAAAHAAAIEMPVSEAVLAVIEGRMDPADSVASLLARQPKAE
ncbi:MAG TPA: NAD(P)H-dependent glycerol-3-phosphate dehydrogenase [Lautropia sp.]|nr:NAD(P)H-dependent glycerol-3-phosphate dehydrogenase [Lautropia sp.]